MLLRSALLMGSSRAFCSKVVPAWVSVASFSRVRAISSTSSSCSATRGAGAAPDVGCAASVTRDLQPQPLWNFFEEISSIPRASKHEAAVLAYVKRFADDRGLPWQEDAYGNIVVNREGLNGGEGAAKVVIQGHVDMVTEKNAGSSHDFLKDPIRLLVEGDWLTADGTTLGADNGIGVSAALALLDLPASSGVLLPPLECLFTVEEEIGLVGAFELDGSMLKGRTMLNLDTVEWGSLFVGCAGGGDSLITLPVEEEAADPASYDSYSVAVEGLMGGHSGINIQEDRGNGVKLLIRVLEALVENVPSLRLVDLKGGDKHNAIPREAFATVLLPKGDPAALKAAEQTAGDIFGDLKMEFGTKEPSLSVQIRGNEEAVEVCLGKGAAQRLLSLLELLPHGVMKISHDVEGLVETSSNLAAVTPIQRVESESAGRNGTYEILCSTRSSLSPPLEAVRSRIKTAAELCGASHVLRRQAYPGWQPNLQSNVLKVARDSLRELLDGAEPGIEALHAGLECGVIGDKAPGMDIVSFGPTIDGAHSPDERVNIDSVGKFWQLVLATLERLAVQEK
ncbi:unnamed protein product [Pylaiella littoralis]